MKVFRVGGTLACTRAKAGGSARITIIEIAVDGVPCNPVLLHGKVLQFDLFERVLDHIQQLFFYNLYEFRVVHVKFLAYALQMNMYLLLLDRLNLILKELEGVLVHKLLLRLVALSL